MGVWKELQAYLGDEFRSDWLNFGDRAAERIAREKGVDGFLTGGEPYLYYLCTKEAIGGHGASLYIDVKAIVPPPGPMVDVLSGVGTHGLAFQARGYDVTFYEEDSRLRAFIEHRVGDDADVYAGWEPDQRFPLAFSFGGVHRRAPDEQLDFVNRMAQLGEVAVLLIHKAGAPFAHPCDWQELQDEIADRYTIVQSVTYGGAWQRIAFESPEPPKESPPEEPPDEVEADDGDIDTMEVEDQEDEP